MAPSHIILVDTLYVLSNSDDPYQATTSSGCGTLRNMRVFTQFYDDEEEDDELHNNNNNNNHSQQQQEGGIISSGHYRFTQHIGRSSRSNIRHNKQLEQQQQ
jgi:hypothetical protein